MTLDEKLDEALKGTFPASDAFYLSPAPTVLFAHDQVPAHPALRLVGDLLDA
jgi:hypothetical protein